eukprot:TRINITY_DN1252_c0_g1_i1.p1 TRINITY_DN1252_c0_g1~~TRINITY_DN1252_c0_g1_i1.p1  ORF type:complete len:875 (-),score=90.54 TRINITY_DN1252_c0_g1_i1:1218-3842(-)
MQYYGKYYMYVLKNKNQNAHVYEYLIKQGKKAYMGNQLASVFNISEQEVSTGGPSSLWKIYRASKKSNNAPVSVFTIEKKQFDKETKSLKEEIFSTIRKEAKTLTKLRHPSILHVLEPLNEDSKIMYFATEPVEGSLKYLIDTPAKRNLIPSELELKTQLLELIETITFLHNNAHLVHLAISPENIYLTSEGKFKIAGFFFSQPLPAADSSISPDINYAISSPTVMLTPHFGFTPPEVVKDNTASAASDAFSVGCFIYNLLQVANNGKSLYFFDVGDHCSRHAYLDEAHKLRSGYTASKLANFSPGAKSLLEQLLVANPAERLKLGDAHSHPWFNDPRIKTLEYLEHLNEKEHQHKLQFLSGLARVLGEFDAKVILRRILPRLASYLSVDKISAHVLPPMIAILEKEGLCSRSDFYTSVWPHLEYLCKGKEISAQTLYLIIKHTEIWLKLLQMQDFQSTLLVLYQKGIDCGVSKIQEHAISIIPTFAKKIEYATLKNQLLPRVLRLAIGTSMSGVRLKCVESISNFASLLDSTTIKGAVVPTLEKLSKTDTDGKLHLTMIKAIETFLKIFSYDELATRVIPLLLGMAVSGQFTKGQFSDLMKLVRKLVDTIDSTRSKVIFVYCSDKEKQELHDIAVSSNEKVEPVKEKMPAMDKGEKDVFDFLNQLGPPPTKDPGEVKVPQKEPENGLSKVPAEQKSDEWDMVFNISKDSTPPAKPEERSPGPAKMKGTLRPPPKAVPPPPKAPSGPMKIAKPTNEGFGSIDFLDMGSKGTAAALSDLDWGSTTGTMNKPTNTAPKGNLAFLNEDPFAELDAPVDNKHSEPKVQAAPTYNPFAAKKKEVKKQVHKNSIDDFFAELSGNKQRHIFIPTIVVMRMV